ncbi:hypothetical protein JXA84_04185 [candidate division WOR-3 bacterium]|nr:hypothetical protein [candidate division WOR-3 bacterium]
MIGHKEKVLRNEFARKINMLVDKSLEENVKTLKAISGQGKPRSFFYLAFSFIACPKCAKHSIYTTLYSMGAEQCTMTTQAMEHVALIAKKLFG